MIIDALKDRYSLPVLLNRLDMAKSSYFYQKKILYREDKFQELRIRIRNIFNESVERYGYRRVYALLKNEGITVSEKVIRRIMKEEKLIVKK